MAKKKPPKNTDAQDQASDQHETQQGEPQSTSDTSKAPGDTSATNDTDSDTNQPRQTDKRPVTPIVVGIGASAGGLEAAGDLLQHLPENTGMAFVVVQHLAPGHESMLTDLLARKTPMPVREVQNGMVVEPNHVYIIPPGKDLGILHGVLQLIPRPDTYGPHLPVDFFFHALAQDLEERAIGVILSGTGSDGSVGTQSIKAAGGITFAQDEESALYPGMPRSAIAAGSIDLVLPPADIAAELVKIARYPYVHLEKAAGIPPDEKSLSRIFFLLRNRTGHDFTYYKHNTIVRRIRRRMLLHKIKKIQDYVRYLQNTPVEIDELFEDILINVTGFFRDQETFEKLKEKVFPQLFKGRSAEEPVRIWVPGCSTGEEAYSIAIALTEFLNGKWSSIPIQIFATDINEKSVNKARAGIYSENIVSDVSSTRLQRYFTQVPGGYQINKLIRDMCVFAVQDVIKDPPFSKLDLVCCRNLLIYLDRDLQKKVLSILHFALNPHGFLLLGTSETVGASADLFSLVDKKVKIYSKKFVSIPIPREITAVPAAPLDFLPAPGKYEKPGRDLHAEAVQFLLERYGPPAVIIDDHMEIVAFSGKTGPYIEPSPGTVSLKLLKMARQDLIADLRAIAFKAIKSNAAARKDNIPFHHNGEKHALNILVTPLQGQKASQRFFAVVFEPAITAPEPSRPKVKIKPDEKDRRIDELEQELLTTREQMQSIINDQITTNEELQTANEEIQSANEEMQSTNEELESAKEELQSTNEELVTVNDELENRNIELGRVNNDLTNLLSSVEIPMVMLSDDLRIRHFTPLAKDLLNLIDTDVGRPITDLKPKINVHNLDRMVSEVINTIRSKAIEAQDEDGHWYSVQIRPYKTTDNRIEGAVLVFIDITDVKQDPEQVHLAAAIMRDSNDAITVQDLEGRILAWNKGAHRMYGYTETEARKMTIWDLVPDNAREAELQLTKRLTAGEAVTSFETLRRTKDGRILDVWLTVSGIRDRTGKIASIASTERDITEIKRNLERVRRLAAVVNDSNDAILVHDFDGNIQAWNSRAEQLYGYTEAQALKMNVLNMISDGQREDYLRCMKRLQAGETIDSFETQRNNKDGQAIAVIVRVTLLVDDAGQPKAIATTERAVKAS